MLVALVEGPRYGYAIMKAMETESAGRITPEIGSLYRTLARLMSGGLVEDTSAPADAAAPHPGRDRKYYRLTPRGRAVARAEAKRLQDLLLLAADRRLLAGRGTP